MVVPEMQAVKNRLASIEGEIKSLGSEIRRLDDKIDNGLARVDERIARLDEKVTAQVARLARTSHNERLCRILNPENTMTSMIWSTQGIATAIG